MALFRGNYLLASVLLCWFGISCSKGRSTQDGAPADASAIEVPPADAPAADAAPVIDAEPGRDLGSDSDSLVCVDPGEKCLTDQDCCGAPIGARCSGGTCYHLEIP
jgi:hypothetical protein